jgi:hypothetical protein
MDLIHLAIKVSKPKATLAYRLLVAALATMTNQSNICYDKEYTRYGVTQYGVVRCTFIAAFSSTILSLRKDIHHRTTTSVCELQRCIRKR